jgi:hypothetical protein
VDRCRLVGMSNIPVSVTVDTIGRTEPLRLFVRGSTVSALATAINSRACGSQKHVEYGAVSLLSCMLSLSCKIYTDFAVNGALAPRTVRKLQDGMI